MKVLYGFKINFQILKRLNSIGRTTKANLNKRFSPRYSVVELTGVIGVGLTTRENPDNGNFVMIYAHLDALGTLFRKFTLSLLYKSFFSIFEFTIN
ncbi:MAG: hypothetical protein IPO04_09965 [Cytophagaceae bacterium]|nr:hypothetical protein [Cytophagaceae bacterium]